MLVWLIWQRRKFPAANALEVVALFANYNANKISLLSLTEQYCDQPSPDTRLYKELRLKGKVVGDGIFASGMTEDTQFQLILQGRGGRALGDFQHWNLIISGAKADYSFYGHFEGSTSS